MSTATDMVTALETALAENVGVVEIRTSDGRTVRYDRDQALKELNFWEQRAQMEAQSGTTGGLRMCKATFKGMN